MAEKTLTLGLVGTTGRMGQEVLKALAAHKSVRLGAVLCRPERVAHHQACVAQHKDVVVCDDMKSFVAHVDVVLDFSAPALAHALAPMCQQMARPYVVASTGLTPEDNKAIDAAAEATAVLVASNLSLGINALLPLIKQISAMLGAWDVEIVEAHHRQKRDAPSGTALSLGEACRLGRGALHDDLSGTARAVPRVKEALGYSVIRGGDIAGEHTIMFIGEQERVEITHRATSRIIFGRGALVAARFVHQQSRGKYTMADAMMSLANQPLVDA